MKKLTQLLLVSLVVTGALLTSCVKDEALNVEADIVSATIDRAKELLIVEPSIGNDQVEFRLIEEQVIESDAVEGSDTENPEVSYIFAPTFTLSKGATISPESGTELDFTEPQNYTVTAEDGITTKVYTVRFFVDKGVLLSYSFENVEVIKTTGPEGVYHEFYTPLGNGDKKKDWDSGNWGYNMLAETLLEEGEELSPAVYPTAQVEGYDGKGVKMQTKSTGSLGPVFGSPLAAGNLFLGYFEFAMPAIKSTKFGQPYTYNVAPAAVKGWFKYNAGEEFVINNEPSELDKDAWDAYAILFEKSDEENFLLGDHNFEDTRMVSVAKLEDVHRVETDEWKEFEIKFENIDGKSFSADKDYMFTIVFSSSKEGAKFNGAVGSQLWIDEVEIVLADE